jgi:hypothetical protein
VSSPRDLAAAAVKLHAKIRCLAPEPNGHMECGEWCGMRPCVVHCHDCAIIRDFARSCIQAAAQEAEGWRPIETAPKDGTWILAVGLNGLPETVRWRTVYAHSVESPQWRNARYGDDVHSLTHWMPLPAPSKEER